MAQIIKESASQQENNSDQRLLTLVEAERKRDEIMLCFQWEEADANRKHEILMAQLMMQMNQGSAYTGAMSSSE